MLIQEIIIILVLVIIIALILFFINKKLHDFNILRNAVILQDINLEKSFNKMDKDYDNIKNKTNDINNKIINKINVDCYGDFLVCDNNEQGNCVQEYKIYKEKKGNGKDCDYENGYKRACPNGGGNCEIYQDCEGVWDESSCDTNNVKTFKVLKNGRGIACNFKHGETEFCNEK
jgi:hypothetical protein